MEERCPEEAKKPDRYRMQRPMITPDLLEVWINAKQEAESKEFQLLWNEKYKCTLYKNDKNIKSFEMNLGLLKNLQLYLINEKYE